MRSIITLTTDFGSKDHYVGVMKGVMLSVNENAHTVDITHCIDSHDISAASFVIGNSYRYFPKKSVHLVVVDPGVGSERRPLAVFADGHFFVGPDNGVFSSVIRSCEDFCAREIKNRDYFLKKISSTFHGRDIFSPVAAHLSLGAFVLRARAANSGSRNSSPRRILDKRRQDPRNRRLHRQVREPYNQHTDGGSWEQGQGRCDRRGEKHQRNFRIVFFGRAWRDCRRRRKLRIYRDIG